MNKKILLIVCVAVAALILGGCRPAEAVPKDPAQSALAVGETPVPVLPTLPTLPTLPERPASSPASTKAPTPSPTPTASPLPDGIQVGSSIEFPDI